MKKVIIDTDPGIDDAVALALATFAKELEVLLVTTVSGNVGIDSVTKNTQQLLSYFGKKIPIAKGCNGPLLGKQIDASEVHGDSGLAGFDFSNISLSPILNSNAVESMAQVLKTEEQPIVICALGPLTNIALLIKLYPELHSKIAQIVIMGGALGRGNYGVYSEFNFAADPYSAKIVIESQIPLVITPLEIGLQAAVDETISSLLKKANKIGLMTYSLFQHYHSGDLSNGLNIFDACTIAYLIQPDLFEEKLSNVQIEITSELTKGASAFAFDSNNNNCRVCTKIDAERFNKWILQQYNDMKLEV